MKKLSTLIIAVIAGSAVYAQPMVSNGFNSMAAINGTTYQKTANLDPGRNYGSVAASADGQYFFAGGANTIANNIYYINVSNNAFVDSITLPSTSGEMATGIDANTLFSVRGSSLYRINTATKAVDSIIIGNPFRVEQRPGAKEAWVASDSMIYVVNYASIMSFTTIDLSSNKFDNSDTRFTKGGSLTYKACNSLKKIYKIDAGTKAVVDSINTGTVGHTAIEVSTDSSKIYAANGTNVYVYSVSTKALVDSMVSTKLIMNLYRHPTRAELWAVHHFNDSVTVFNETTGAIIASFDIGNDPFFLAFSIGSTGVTNVQNNYDVKLYPNPASKQMTVVLPDNKEKQLVICDLFGRKQTTLTTTSNTVNIDIAGLATGNYYLAVYERNTLIKTISFVKE